jgi:DNA-binding HxlR family transcriptional regulator
MPRKRYGQACPVAKSLELVGERWTLLVVRDLLRGVRKFQDLQASLPGIAPALLSERLKLMEEHGLVTRRFYSEHPPRAEYLLTDKGRGLAMVVGALAMWGSRHLHPQTALVHADCGHEVTLRYFCPTCDARLPGEAVALRRAGDTGSRPRRRAGTGRGPRPRRSARNAAGSPPRRQLRREQRPAAAKRPAS